MEIVIEGPTFLDHEDEELFFQLIYSLPGYESVKGSGHNLHIHFKDQISEKSANRLILICKRWHINLDTLKTIKTTDNEYLFNNEPEST